MERVSEAALRRQRAIQTTLLFIILATLPCYCLGALLLLTSPSQRGGVRTPTPPPITATEIGEPTNTPYPSITPFQIPSPPTQVNPLLPTPTQIFLFPTLRPTLTFTPFFPSRTPVVLPSITPIIIIPPTSTSRPPTAIPTTALPPTAIPTTAVAPTAVPPTATLTFTAPPTSVTTAPTITLTPSVTLTPTDTLTPPSSKRQPTMTPSSP